MRRDTVTGRGAMGRWEARRETLCKGDTYNRLSFRRPFATTRTCNGSCRGGTRREARITLGSTRETETETLDGTGRGRERKREGGNAVGSAGGSEEAMLQHMGIRGARNGRESGRGGRGGGKTGGENGVVREGADAATQVGIGGTTRDEETQKAVITGDPETVIGTAGARGDLQT